MDPRLAARRRQVQEGKARRNLTRVLVVLALAATVGGVAWVLRSPLFSVSRLVLQGHASSRAPEILHEAGVREGVPLVEISAGEVAAALQADPWIREASLRKDWPRTVIVRVEERFPVAWLETASGWALTAADGVVLQLADTPGDDLPRVLLGHPAVSPGGRVEDQGTLEFAAALRADLRAQLVVEQSQGELWARVGEVLVRLGRGVEMEEKARVLAVVLDSGVPPGSVVTLVAPSRPAIATP